MGLTSATWLVVESKYEYEWDACDWHLAEQGNISFCLFHPMIQSVRVNFNCSLGYAHMFGHMHAMQELNVNLITTIPVSLIKVLLNGMDPSENIFYTFTF